MVAARFAAWADAADRQFAGRPWTVDAVRFGEVAPRPTRLAQAARRRLAGAISDRLPRSAAAAVRRAPLRGPGALAACGVPSCRPLHRPQLGRAPRPPPTRPAGTAPGSASTLRTFTGASSSTRPRTLEHLRLTRLVEEQFIPQCDYVTAASDGIAGGVRRRAWHRPASDGPQRVPSGRPQRAGSPWAIWQPKSRRALARCSGSVRRSGRGGDLRMCSPPSPSYLTT